MTAASHALDEVFARLRPPFLPPAVLADVQRGRRDSEEDNGGLALSAAPGSAPPAAVAYAPCSSVASQWRSRAAARRAALLFGDDDAESRAHSGGAAETLVRALRSRGRDFTLVGDALPADDGAEHELLRTQRVLDASAESEAHEAGDAGSGDAGAADASVPAPLTPLEPLRAAAEHILEERTVHVRERLVRSVERQQAVRTAVDGARSRRRVVEVQAAVSSSLDAFQYVARRDELVWRDALRASADCRQIIAQCVDDVHRVARALHASHARAAEQIEHEDRDAASASNCSAADRVRAEARRRARARIAAEEAARAAADGAVPDHRTLSPAGQRRQALLARYDSMARAGIDSVVAAVEARGQRRKALRGDESAANQRVLAEFFDERIRERAHTALTRVRKFMLRRRRLSEQHEFALARLPEPRDLAVESAGHGEEPEVRVRVRSRGCSR